jgi:hypothetical protein
MPQFLLPLSNFQLGMAFLIAVKGHQEVVGEMLRTSLSLWRARTITYHHPPGDYYRQA